MKLSLLYLFAIANSKLIRRETEGDDALVVDTAVDQAGGESTEEVALESESVDGNTGNQNQTQPAGDDQAEDGVEQTPENLEANDQTETDDSATGDQADDGTATDDATGGEAADGTADDTAAGDDTALDGEAAAATGNGTDSAGGSAMTMMISSIFVVLFMIIH